MKNLLIDKEDLKYLNNHFKNLGSSGIVRLKEMQPNKNTLRIIRGQENLTKHNNDFKKVCPLCECNLPIDDDNIALGINGLCSKCAKYTYEIYRDLNIKDKPIQKL